METAKYLDRLLMKYSNTFNIYKSYRIGTREYPAYGYFFSRSEKYILIQEANMWAADSYEHIIFLQEEAIREQHVVQAEELIQGHMEEVLVRKGNKYPSRNHMSSILTVVLLSQKSIDRDVIKRIRKYHFDKGYLFHFRGYCQGRILAVGMEDKQVYACRCGKDCIPLLQGVFEEVIAGMEGFDAACKAQNIQVYKQEPAY